MRLKNLKTRTKINLIRKDHRDMAEKFTAENFYLHCDRLAKKDKDLERIIKQHGYPPMWTRPASFQSLILFILEQQVSLASAYAAFKKLKEKIGFVTPAKILLLSDEELRACYFSRQKIIYARELAQVVNPNNSF
jgi:DNA-3-methyladenine glycosylase II